MTRTFMESRLGANLRAASGDSAALERDADHAAEHAMHPAGPAQPSRGYDFSRVRVHTDATAAESARADDALAYTTGKHIAFASGQFAPHTAAGRRLLAHELAHVVQQRGLAVHAATGTPLVQRQQRLQTPPPAQRPNLLLDDAPAFRGCSPHERFRIEYQLARARSLVATAQADVDTERARTDRSSGPITIAGGAVQRYFHTSDARAMRTLSTRLGAIATRLARGPSNWVCVTVEGCVEHCAASYSAAACAEPGSPTYLCPRHFQQNDLTGSLTIIHEAAHQAGLGLPSPGNPLMAREVYADDPRFAGLSTARALDNPDSYAHLVGWLRYGVEPSTLAANAWTARDMSFAAAVREPNIGAAEVGRVPAAVGYPPSLARFPAGTTVARRFAGEMVFRSSYNELAPRRPGVLRPPTVLLRIELQRAGSAQARAGRPLRSVLVDQTVLAHPARSGILIPESGGNGIAFDLSFDPDDRGTLHLSAELRDPDTATTLTFRDSLPVRP